MLSNIAEKMDYYVESSYLDKTKDETFDGIAYINNYAVKLNSVTDETIKRLRFASENSKKVFGSKPNSLTGEITNLKVNVLELDDNYLVTGTFDSYFSDELSYVIIPFKDSNYELVLKKGISLYYDKTGYGVTVL